MLDKFNYVANQFVVGDMSSVANGIKSYFVDGWGKTILPSLAWAAFVIGLIIVVVGFVAKALSRSYNGPGPGKGFLIMLVGIAGIIGFDKIYNFVTSIFEKGAELIGL